MGITEDIEKLEAAQVDLSKELSVSIASTASEPTKAPTGPYWQMAYYAVAGFFFWAILIIQLPMIDKYFGGNDVVFYITFAYGVASNVIRVFLLWYGARTKSSQGTQMKNLVLFGSAFTALSMIAFPISMAIMGTDNGHVSVWIAIFLSAKVGLWNSLLMNAGFNLMSLAPEKSANFFLLAQTFTGVVTWPLLIFLRYIVKSAGGGSETDIIVAAISFSLASGVVLGCIPLYLFKTRHHSVFVNVLGPTASRAPTPEMYRDSPNSGFARLASVFKTIFTPAMSVWLCGLVTFSVYPSQISRWYPDGDFEVSIYRSFLAYCFAICDTVGRSLPRFVPQLLKASDKFFWILTISRAIVFVPMFLLCSKTVSEFFSNDYVRLGIMIVFAISNGMNFSTPNMIGPRRVQTADKIHAGTILSLMAVNGVFIGTMLSLGLKVI